MAQTITMPALETIKVHPAADLFPMMSDEELQDLAASIAENGQLTPIMMQSGLLIDGRNRLAACKLANVKPVFAELPRDVDPVPFIVAANLDRRDMTKGQKAMLLAMIYPDGEQGRGRNAAARKVVVSTGFSPERLTQARQVLRHSRSLAESVVKGIKTFDVALETMRKEQQLDSSDEAQLVRLQQSAPDLAEQVNEEQLKLDEAMAALAARQQRLRTVCDSGRAAAVRLATDFSAGVSAMVDAHAAGEPIRLPKGALKLIRNHFELLKKEITFDEPVE